MTADDATAGYDTGWRRGRERTAEGATLFEDRDTHFAPALVRSRFILAALCCGIVVTLLWIVVFAGRNHLARSPLLLAEIVAVASAAVMGNTCRLRDHRTRLALTIRGGSLSGRDLRRAVAELPPRRTIRRRFAAAAVGTLLAAGALVAVLPAAWRAGHAQVACVVTLATLASCVGAWFCGALTRPLD